MGFHLRSFARFLQLDTDPQARRDEGLQGALRAVFPVRSGDEIASLEFVDYHLEAPRFDEPTCLRRGLTFAAPLKVTVRIFVFEGPDTSEPPWTIRDIKEQEVFFGELPWMTARGTFVLDGVERVLTPYLVPPAGLRHVPREHGTAATLHDALGNALELSRPESSKAVEVRVRPGPFTASDAVLCPRPHFRTLHLSADGVFAPFDDAPTANRAAPWNVTAADGRIVATKGQKLTARRRDALRDAGLPGVPLSARDTRRHRTAGDVRGIDGSVVLSAHTPLHAAALRELLAAGVTEVAAYLPDVAAVVPDTIVLPDTQAAQHWMHQHLVGFDLDAAFAWLDASEAGAAVDPKAYAVLAAGEAFTAYTLRALRTMAREARERMDRGDVDTLMPHDLLNARALWRALHTLLTSSATSVPWAQVNPRASLDHLRRVELGPGVVWPSATEGPVLLPPEVALGPGWEGLAALAEPLVHPEVPRDDDDGAEVLRATGAVTQAAHDGRVLVVDERVVLVVPDDPEAEVQMHEVRAFRAGNGATSRAERVVVADGARVRRGEILVEGEAVVAGRLALGRTVRVAFSDALAAGEAQVSARVLAAGWFTSRWVPARQVEQRDTGYGCEELTATPPDAVGAAARHLDASGIAALGSVVHPGDVLVGARRPGPQGTWMGISLRAPEAGVATVRHVEIFARRGRDPSPRHEALLDDERALWEQVAARAWAAMGPVPTRAFDAVSALCQRRLGRCYVGDDLPPGVISRVLVTLEIARTLAVGDRLADRHGLVATVCGVVSDDVMPARADGGRADVLLSSATALSAGTRREAGDGRLYLVKIPGP